MKSNKTVFAQLLEFIPKREFNRFVASYRGNLRIRSFTCWDQFLCMCFAQLTNRDSLRDIETCLRSIPKKSYRFGLRGNVSRSTLADANENRDSRIYGDFCRYLMKQAQELYSNERFSKELDEIVYALDSTYVSLCLSLCPWSELGAHRKGMLKVHTLLDLRGSIPSFIAISSGKHPDCKMLDNIQIEPGAFYVMDKAYVDFKRLNNMNEAGGFFVTRSKRNLKFSRVSSTPVDKGCGLRSDQRVKLTGRIASNKYHSTIRRVRYYDAPNERYLTFLTNNFSLEALAITKLYKERWQVEIFFKWIKQNLRIKKFYGTSKNAIETQIWIAISTYLLVAIAKKRLQISQPLYQILQFLSLSLFEEIPILQAFSGMPLPVETQENDKQLKLQLS